MALTVKGAASAKPGRYSDGDGLYLLVAPGGSKSWVLRTMAIGHTKDGELKYKRCDIGLGGFLSEPCTEFSDVPLMQLKHLTLAEARDKARELRRIAKSRRDPKAARDYRPITVPTFLKAAEVCHEEGPPSRWSKKHSDAFLASLKQHAFPKLGRLQVDGVEENAIVTVLAPLWHDKPAAAKKLRQRIRTVLDFAKVKGWRAVGSPTISPRQALGKQPRSGNFAMMPYSDVPEFVSALREKPSTVGRMALLFTILTAARSGEVRHARWDQIDFDRAEWTRPAAMMKSDKEHVVTLSPAALALLEAAKAFRMVSSPLIFPGTKGQPLSDMTLLKVVKAEELPFAVHGFRASFRTWASEERPTIPDSVAEAALAHSVGDEVVKAYNRATFLKLRRELLDAWSGYCSGAPANVVQLVREA